MNFARLRRVLTGNVAGLLCALFIVILVVLALAVPLLPLPDPTGQSVVFRLKPPRPITCSAPTASAETSSAASCGPLAWRSWWESEWWPSAVCWARYWGW